MGQNIQNSCVFNWNLQNENGKQLFYSREQKLMQYEKINNTDDSISIVIEQFPWKKLGGTSLQTIEMWYMSNKKTMHTLWGSASNMQVLE